MRLPDQRDFNENRVICLVYDYGVVLARPRPLNVAVKHSFESMVAFSSTSRTLFCGDILGSGTVGTGCGAEQDRFLKPGDKIRIEIDQLDAIENKVTHEK